jgi:hypothetical protein
MTAVAVHVVSEQGYPVHILSAGIQVIQLTNTRSEHAGCRRNCEKSSTSLPCTNEEKLGNFRWIIFGSPWR